jgi:hypothetical protein
MMRRLFTISAVVSLLVCLGTCALWARSYWISDSLEWKSHFQLRFIGCIGGRVLFQVNHGPSGTNESAPVTHDAYTLRPRDHYDLGRPWRFAGFWIENLSFAPSETHSAWLPYTDIVVPLYAVALLTLVTPTWWLLKTIRRRKSLVSPSCGQPGGTTADDRANSAEPSAIRIAA